MSDSAGSYGRLATLAGWLAGAQGGAPPQPLSRVRAIIVAGDARLAPTAESASESASESTPTRTLVSQVLAGGSALNTAARAAGATVRVVDIAVAGDVPGAPVETTRHKVRSGSGRIDIEDAMSAADTTRALAAGAAIADEEVDAGADLLVTGSLGGATTIAAATLIATLTSSEPVAVVDWHGGADADWVRRVAIVRDARHRARGAGTDPVALVGCVGGPSVAALAGLLAQAAQRRTPVVLDGLVTFAAALLAEQLTPGAAAWWVAGTRSPEPAQALALARLGLSPLLDLGLRLDDGTGALLAVPLLTAAVTIMSGRD
jgi:nicotinate-nucleotide--dimethylbenzimidazole phosphoribosyltransferase